MRGLLGFSRRRSGARGRWSQEGGEIPRKPLAREETLQRVNERLVETALMALEAVADRERLVTQVADLQRRAEALAGALQAERDILQAVMENTRTCLAYLDRDLRCVMVNSAFVSALNRPRAAIVGTSYLDLFPDPQQREILERVRGEEIAADLRNVSLASSNEGLQDPISWDWTIVPVKDTAGQVEGMVLSLLGHRPE